MSDEQVLAEKAKVIIAKVAEKKNSEQPESTKERLKKTLAPRDAAMNAIRNYQQKVGVPSENEIVGHFLREEAKEKIGVNEFLTKENEDEV